MSWVVLLFAGLLEIGWAVSLKYSQGLTRPLPTALTLVLLLGSVGLLAVAVRTLPVGTAYAVWVGIGAAGAAVLGVVLFGEPLTAPRVFFLVLLLVAVVGLKVTSGTR